MVNLFKTEQEALWASQFGADYIQRNQSNLLPSQIYFFVLALLAARGFKSCLEFSANMGANLKALNTLYPSIDAHGIEIYAEVVPQSEEVITPDYVFHI